MFNTQFLATASNLNGMTRPTSAAGTSHATIVTRRIAYVWSLGLCGHDNQPVEWLSCLEHPVHDDGQLTRHCNGGTLDTKTLSKPEPPILEVTVISGFGSREHDHRRFVEKASQVAISSTGDVAVVIDFSGLISSRGQPEPGANRARSLEVVWIFNRR